MEKTKSYICHYSLFKGGTHYRPGEVVELTEEEAAPLLEDGTLIPGPVEEPPKTKKGN